MREPSPVEEHPDNVPEVFDDPNSPDTEPSDTTPYPDVADTEIEPEDEGDDDE